MRSASKQMTLSLVSAADVPRPPETVLREVREILVQMLLRVARGGAPGKEAHDDGEDRTESR